MKAKKQLLLLLVCLLLKKRQSIRNRHYLTREALLPPDQSPWRHVWNSRDDRAMLNTTGLTWEAFQKLLELFLANSKDIFPKNKGRKRLLTMSDILGLVLHWLNSPIRQKSLGQIFGIPPASVCEHLWTGLHYLHLSLSKASQAEVCRPNVEEMQTQANFISAREPLLTHSFGFVDGLNMPMEEPKCPNKQNAYYNGWLAGCYVSNVLVFLPSGKICFAALNRPGSWHDSAVAVHLYDQLQQETPSPFNILADSAFPTSGACEGKILAVRKESFWNRSMSQRQYIMHKAMDKAVKSQRQAAEWGMRAIQAAFTRLKQPLPTDNRKRLLIIETAVFLHNFRTEEVGLNQIRTVFLNAHRVEDFYNETD